ncbi:Solute carrier family 25 member 45 [Liparis tanakae]|uniref:Solute carrier family 25 member 45 n=1 Tax=Liparis tanakae TaxID=230148 RepID=A0A4Z2G5T0_9TELE|nr:Solute carrier family 25 member 45 [Liparis tanakae]
MSYNSSTQVVNLRKDMPIMEFIAGSLSGALGLAVGHPLDTVKVRLQAQSSYQGILHCMSQTYSNEGLRGFFKGMAFPVLTAGINNSVIFGSYSNALDYLTESRHADRDRGKPASAAQVFAAGCFSGLMQVHERLGFHPTGPDPPTPPFRVSTLSIHRDITQPCEFPTIGRIEILCK